MTDTTLSSVVNPDLLNFKTYNQNGALVADIDWSHLIKAKVYYYPANYEAPFHILSGDILHVILQGEVEFQEMNGEPETATAGMFHKCGIIPWRTRVIKDTYFLVIQNEEINEIYLEE